MDHTDDIKDKVIFFVSPPEPDKQSVDILVMLTELGWDYIRTARTATLDLNKVGVPLRIILSGARNTEEGMAILEPFLDKQDDSTT